MNKRVYAILLAALVILAAAFFWLWQREQPAPSEMVQLCQGSAAAALEQFRVYSSAGEDSHYWYGVAEFRSFMKAYHCLNENVSDADYLYCNEVYGQMVLYPEKVMAHMDGLIEALEYLAGDYTDPNGYHLMSVLKNELIHGADQPA